MRIDRDHLRLWQLGAIDAGAPLLSAPIGYVNGPILLPECLVWDLSWDDCPIPADVLWPLPEAPETVPEHLRNALPEAVRYVTDMLRARGSKNTPRGPAPQWTGNDLARFVSLHRREDAAILAFAETWGRLEVCEHGLPLDHYRDAAGRRGMCPWYNVGPIVVEELAHWRAFSRRAEALLNIAAALGQEPPQCGKREDWEAAHSHGLPEFPEEEAASWNLDMDRLGRPDMRKTAVEQARSMLKFRLDQWISSAGVTVSLIWEGSTPRMRLVSGEHDGSLSLLGTIGVSLLTTIAHADRLAMCSGCGAPFLVKRRGGAGTRRFCADCGRSEAVRQASRDYYARKRAKQQQAAEPEGQL